MHEGRQNFGVVEAVGCDLVWVFVNNESSGNAACPQCHNALKVLREFPLKDDVGDRKKSAVLEDAERFSQDDVLIGSEVDDAVRNDDIDRLIRERNIFDSAEEELSVLHAGFQLVLSSKLNHFRCHIKSVDLASWPDATRGEEHVNTTARTEVEDDLTGQQRRECGWIAAAQRREDSSG